VENGIVPLSQPARRRPSLGETNPSDRRFLGSAPAPDGTNPIRGARRNKPKSRRTTEQTRSPAPGKTNPIPAPDETSPIPALDETNPIPAARRNKPNPSRPTEQTQSPPPDGTNPIPPHNRKRAERAAQPQPPIPNSQLPFYKGRRRPEPYATLEVQ
jgi:hypothetical protein